MHTTRRFLTIVILLSVLPPLSSVAQTVLTNFPVGYLSNSIATNPVTNRIYVGSGNDNTVTVINGSDDSTVTVPAGFNPTALAVNTVTNKLYVADYSDYVLTIIDGATNQTSTVPISGHPVAVAVNSLTNKIYALASGQNDSGILNVIDGATLATTTLATGNSPGSGTGSNGFNGTYQVQSSGRGVVADNDGQQAIVYIANPNRCYVLPVTANAAFKVLSSRQGYQRQKTPNNSSGIVMTETR